MGRKKNDGRGRMGGRDKGTPNKATSTLREWVIQLVNDNRALIERDLKEMDPEERVAALLKLLGFVMPKPQSVVMDVNANVTELEGGTDGDPLAKPPGFHEVIGATPWEELNDRQKAAYLSEHYSRLAHPSDDGAGLYISFVDESAFEDDGDNPNDEETMSMKERREKLFKSLGEAD